MADDAKWYVVHTYSGYEAKVAATILSTVENRKLQDLIFEVNIPLETVTELDKNGKPVEVERKLFPGYVLVKMVMTDESWHVVRNVRGVTGFVGPGSKPVALTDEEVRGLGVEKHAATVSFEVGDSVRIIDGAVDEINPESGTVRVIVSMFGRDTPVELELGQVAQV